MFGKKGLVAGLLLLALLPLRAQGFHISVECSASLRGSFELYVFDRQATPSGVPDGVPRRIKARTEGGIATFSGNVAGIAYSELRHPDVRRPLGFFIENADIHIKYNPSDPNTSPITGSRANAQVRYQLEVCGTSPSPADCLARYVDEEPTSPIAAYLIEHLLADEADSATLATLCARMEGSARQSHHFRQLQRRMERQRLLATGSPLPSFDCTGPDGTPLPVDTLLQDSCYHLLIVGASWCRQCQAVEQTLRDSHPDVMPVVLQLDHEKRGWDAPFMQTLDVNHIPYLVLLDPNRRIVARDIRIWELGKYYVP